MGGVTSIVVIAIGVVLNALSFYIWSCKTMRVPTALYMRALAFFDLVLLLAAFPETLQAVYEFIKGGLLFVLKMKKIQAQCRAAAGRSR